jgi:hypothetical protein
MYKVKCREKSYYCGNLKFQKSLEKIADESEKKQRLKGWYDLYTTPFRWMGTVFASLAGSNSAHTWPSVRHRVKKKLKNQVWFTTPRRKWSCMLTHRT